MRLLGGKAVAVTISFLFSMCRGKVCFAPIFFARMKLLKANVRQNGIYAKSIDGV